MRTIPFTHTNLDVSHPPSAPLYILFSLNWVRGGGCDGFGGELRGSRAASALDAEREWRRGPNLGAAHHHLSIRDLAGVPAGNVAVEYHLSSVELAERTRAAGVRRRSGGGGGSGCGGGGASRAGRTISSILVAFDMSHELRSNWKNLEFLNWQRADGHHGRA